MNIESTKLIYFSPTRTTRTILEGIARGIQADTVDTLDLTPPEAKTQAFAEMRHEMAIIGAPVYGGRIPIDAVQRMRRLKGNGTPAVVVVVYGNRAYEDALLELKELAVERGFKPVAGGAFIGEHSFSNDSTPIARARPDSDDVKTALGLGRAIRRKMRAVNALDEIPPLQVPGNHPYKERGERSTVAPTTREKVCGLCGTCATVCPTGAISVTDTVLTEPSLCILCCACVKNCPTGARVMEDPGIRRSADWLFSNCSERKEPETFLWGQTTKTVE